MSSTNVGQAKRIAFTSERGFKLHVKQSVSVSYRRATTGSKPKNAREFSKAN